MKKVKRKKKNILLRIALVAFSVYLVVVITQLQLEIREKQKRIDELNASISTHRKVNENLTKQTENLEQYLQQQAYERGWALPGEIVLVEIPGAKE